MQPVSAIGQRRTWRNWHSRHKNRGPAGDSGTSEPTHPATRSTWGGLPRAGHPLQRARYGAWECSPCQHRRQRTTARNRPMAAIPTRCVVLMPAEVRRPFEAGREVSTGSSSDPISGLGGVRGPSPRGLISKCATPCSVAYSTGASSQLGRALRPVNRGARVVLGLVAATLVPHGLKRRFNVALIMRQDLIPSRRTEPPSHVPLRSIERLGGSNQLRSFSGRCIAAPSGFIAQSDANLDTPVLRLAFGRVVGHKRIVRAIPEQDHARITDAVGVL
jgi:hypothetical protein